MAAALYHCSYTVLYNCQGLCAKTCYKLVMKSSLYLATVCAGHESKASASSLNIDVGSKSAIKAMESLIQTSFGRASPSRMTLEDSCRESPPNTVSSGCRSQSVETRGDEETPWFSLALKSFMQTSFGPASPSRMTLEDSSPPNTLVPPVPSPAETPRRAPSPAVEPTTPTRSPPDADSSTFLLTASGDDAAVKEEQTALRLEKDSDAALEGPVKRRAADVDGLFNTDAKRRAEDRDQIRSNCDDMDDDRPTSTSSGRLTALESLQGLVYRQTLNPEHPLDSLQKLIYGGPGAEPSHVSVQLAAGQKGAGASDSDQFQTGRSPVLAPQTLILVNPIVTVVSQGGGSDVPLFGDQTTPVPSAPAAGGTGSAGESSGSSEDAGEQAVPVPRVYRCRACRRKFSSKGSYRYHLSRCHVLATVSSPKAACEATRRHKFHSQSDHHRDGDSSMPVAAAEPSGDVSISAGSTFGGCAPLEDSGRHLQAHYFAEAK